MHVLLGAKLHVKHPSSIRLNQAQSGLIRLNLFKSSVYPDTRACSGSTRELCGNLIWFLSLNSVWPPSNLKLWLCTLGRTPKPKTWPDYDRNERHTGNLSILLICPDCKTLRYLAVTETISTLPCSPKASFVALWSRQAVATALISQASSVFNIYETRWIWINIGISMDSQMWDMSN